MNKFLKILFMICFSFVLTNSALAIERPKYVYIHDYLKSRTWGHMGHDLGDGDDISKYGFYVNDRFLKLGEIDKARYIIYNSSPWSITYKLLPPKPYFLTSYNYILVEQACTTCTRDEITISLLKTLEEDELRRSIYFAKTYMDVTGGLPEGFLTD